MAGASVSWKRFWCLKLTFVVLLLSSSASLAQQKRAKAKAAAQDKVKVLKPSPVRPKVAPKKIEKRKAPPPAAPEFGFRFSGFILTGYRLTLNTSNRLRLGESDGFYVSRARMKMAARLMHFRAVMSVDGIFDRGADPLDLTPATRSLFVSMRDAYLQYVNPVGFFVTIGQHKIPFSMHSERSNAEEHFILYPLIFSGEDVTFGRAARSIVPTRDIGITIGFDRNFGMVGLKLEAMVYNGDGENRFANDSDLPAIASRFRLAIGSFLKIGASFLWNQRRAGSDPNLLFDESEIAFGADISFTIAGFFLEGEFAASNRTFNTTNEQPAFGFGFRTDAGYRIRSIGLEFAVRFELYDPTDQFDDDQLIYITPAISWYYRIWKTHQIAIRLNYTIKLEQTEAQTLNNDQLNLLFLYKF